LLGNYRYYVSSSLKIIIGYFFEYFWYIEALTEMFYGYICQTDIAPEKSIFNG